MGIQKYLNVIGENHISLVDKSLAINLMKLLSEYSIFNESNQGTKKELEMGTEKAIKRFGKLSSADLKQWDQDKRVCGSGKFQMTKEIRIKW